MKLFLFEEEANKNFDEQGAQKRAYKLIDNSDLSIIYKSGGHTNNYKKIVSSFERHLKLGDKNIALIDVDWSNEGSMGGAGEEIVGELWDVFSSIDLKLAIVFIVNNPSLLIQICRGLINWMRERKNNKDLKDELDLIGQIVFVINKKNGDQIKFIFFNYFDIKTIKRAFKEIIKLPLQKIEPVKGNTVRFVFDTKEKKWKPIQNF